MSNIPEYGDPEYSDTNYMRKGSDAIKEAEKAKEVEKAKGPAQGRLDIDDAEQKNREANKKSSIQDLRDLREGKITNEQLKERVRARGGVGGAGMGDIGMKGIGKKSKLDYAKGGKISSASKRGDGCCIKGKTKGRMV